MDAQVRECSIANALAVVGERWSLLALREILFGVRRFDQIQRNTGASRDILATRLRALVAAGVLDKVEYERHPPRYEYVPTQAGEDLRYVLAALMEWGDRYVTEGEPPTVFRHVCGEELQVRRVCEHCDTELRPGDMTLERTRWREPAGRA
ncbi:winged helix-turn-helix transcriptional regulator [Pseudonocardia spinosispora]|uniref:winged helix-turn-helix transcriptional regulator n=1 Tax=Pseudonocardia spinosispora TaxID=103441 RepID=UPI00048DAD5F|nr:helix-turn-helix domain-containing protein [Pseudonocardia spinosispora]